MPHELYHVDWAAFALNLFGRDVTAEECNEKFSLWFADEAIYEGKRLVGLPIRVTEEQLEERRSSDKTTKLLSKAEKAEAQMEISLHRGLGKRAVRRYLSTLTPNEAIEWLGLEISVSVGKG